MSQADNRRPRILICDKIVEEGIKAMQDFADVDLHLGPSPEDLLKLIPNYEGVVVRSATKITAETIAHGLRLKVIGRAGSGLDSIDVAAAKAREIEVVNSPDANSLAVAEHTLGLLLALARRLPRADMGLKAGKWEKKKLMGTGLAGKTLGIIGFGRIGREVAHRAQAFGMKIVVNQRRSTPELELEAGIQTLDLYDLLRQADFVTLHVPLRPETENLLGAKELALMKPSAYLLNTARGGVINEDALLEALNSEKLAGAALDVFVEEPATHNALAQHERVIATPHIAASTEDAQRSAALTIAEKMAEVLQHINLETVLPLRVVAMDKVFPHEHIDPRRVNRLAKRFDTDGYLSNPPIVIEAETGYMVLDGATRTSAFRQLGFEHAIVQVASLEAGLGLDTWYHVIQNISQTALFELLHSISDISLIESNPADIQDKMFEYGGLCYLHTLSDAVYLISAAEGANRLDALNALTEAYISASEVERTLDSNIISLQHSYPAMSAVMIFPAYTVEQVLHLAQSGRRFPAGITRFIIPGRILRLNADLNMLKSNKSLREKNRWLHDMLTDKLRRGGIRYYQEPVYLLDE